MDDTERRTCLFGFCLSSGILLGHLIGGSLTSMAPSVFFVPPLILSLLVSLWSNCFRFFIPVQFACWQLLRTWEQAVWLQREVEDFKGRRCAALQMHLDVSSFQMDNELIRTPLADMDRNQLFAVGGAASALLCTVLGMLLHIILTLIPSIAHALCRGLSESEHLCTVHPRMPDSFLILNFNTRIHVMRGWSGPS